MNGLGLVDDMGLGIGADRTAGVGDAIPDLEAADAFSDGLDSKNTDFNDGGGLDGWKDVSETRNVTAELLQRGYSEADIANYRRGFSYYQKREWKLATEALGQAKDIPAAEIMRDRCQDILKRGEVEPLNQKLKDGVWHHDEK